MVYESRKRTDKKPINEPATMDLEVRLIIGMIHGWFAGIISDYFRE